MNASSEKLKGRGSLFWQQALATGCAKSDLGIFVDHKFSWGQYWAVAAETPQHLKQHQTVTHIESKEGEGKCQS